MVELRLDSVTLGYQRRPVIKAMSLEAKPGQVLGLVGPNGCGKSTLIKALSRVIAPYSGSILLNGRDISRIPRMELARLVAVVPQMPLLPSSFTAFEIVLMGRNPHLGLLQPEGKQDIAVAWRSMEQTGTQQLAHRKVGRLSGGEIQSVVIARVLAQQTQAILLDEPTSNLDIGRQIEVLDLIKGLCLRQNLTVVIALHELNLAAQYCDRLVLIDNGEIYCQGAPAEVITKDNIRQVYDSSSYIYSHPLSGLPVVLPTAGSSKYGTDDTG
jgi:iron complex transport system ATP-binding protein